MDLTVGKEGREEAKKERMEMCWISLLFIRGYFGISAWSNLLSSN